MSDMREWWPFLTQKKKRMFSTMFLYRDVLFQSARKPTDTNKLWMKSYIHKNT